MNRLKLVGETDVQILDESGKSTHQVSADGILKLWRDVENWQQLAKTLEGQLEMERGKIRRLMAALADEIVK